MALLISIANGINHFAKGVKHIGQLSKKAIRTGSNAVNVLKNPLVILQMLLSSIVRTIKQYAIILFIGIFLIVGVLGIVVEGAKSVYDQIVSTITSSFGAVTGWDLGEKVKELSYNMSEEQIKEMLDAGSPFNPKNLSTYIEVEQNTTPVKYDTFRKYKVTTRTGSGVNVNDKDIPYKLNLLDTAYDYRLPWEFILGLDVINDTSLKTDYNSKKIVREAEQQLPSIYTWGYDKYSKDVTDWVQYWEVKEKDGRVVYEKMTKEVETYDSRPLPLLDKVETMFKDYNFTIDEDVTEDTGWTEGNYSTYSWTEEEGTGRYRVVGKDENGKDIEEEITRTVSYSITTYNRYRTLTVEDKEQYISEIQTGFRLNSFIDDLKLGKTSKNEDMSLLYEIIRNFNNTQELQSDLEDFIGLEYVVGGSTGNYLVNPGNITIRESEFKGNLPFFHQKDSRWGGISYGGLNTIGSSGCGPTSMAMAITAFGGYSPNVDLNNDRIIDPYEAAKWSANKGYRAIINGKDVGTYWSYFAAIGREVGLSVREVGTSQYREVITALEQGKLVVSSMKRGTFTRGGHFILLVGVDGNGDILVNDPNSVERSNKAWSFSRIILPESNKFWIISN